MRGTVMYGARDVRFEERPDPAIVDPTDAIIRLSATCICGSDLWPYRGANAIHSPAPMGHEYCGIVEETGRDVSAIQKGQFVIGRSSRRITRVRIVGTATRRRARIERRSSARRRRSCACRSRTGRWCRRASCAERIITMSRHKPRQQLAREFGATDIVSERGEDGISRIKELTNDVGADSVLECVGTPESMAQAIGITRPGGSVGYVGVPHGVTLDAANLFFRHVRLLGGPAPVRRYLPDLIDRVLNGRMNPGKVFDLALPLRDVAAGYRAMDERRAIKTLLRP